MKQVELTKEELAMTLDAVHEAIRFFQRKGFEGNHTDDQYKYFEDQKKKYKDLEEKLHNL